MVRRYSLILGLAFFLIGCRPATPTPTATPIIVASPSPESAFTTPDVLTQTPTPGGVTAKQVMNSLYELGTSDSLQTVQLVDGVYTQGQPGDTDYLKVQVNDPIALGDLTADGIGEAAVVVSEYRGGSGVFDFLAVYAEQNDQAVFQTSVFVDDRPKIDGLEIKDNEVRLAATVHRLDEPVCCPTLETLRHYRLINNQLDMTDYAT